VALVLLDALVEVDFVTESKLADKFVGAVFFSSLPLLAPEAGVLLLAPPD
jgi:hypothetical protein